MVDDDREASDDAAINQSLHPRTCSIRAQTNFSTKLAMSHSPINSQCTEYFSVNLINHSDYHCTDVNQRYKTVPHTAEMSA